MDPRSKRRWTYVATTVIGAIIIIAAIILLQQPLQNKTTPPPSKTPPVATTGAASGVTTNAATLNGALALLGSASTVTVGFVFGTDLTHATNVSDGSASAPAAFRAALSGLSSATKYYFQAWALGDGFTLAGIQSFTTQTATNPQTHGPSVSTQGATAVGNASATLNGDLSALGTASSVTVGFRYGQSPTLADAVNASAGGKTTTGMFDSAVSGLASNTTYYVQAWALGNGFANGSILTFTTEAASGGSGNGHQVPPGWAHAACPDIPAQAPAHGVRVRCTLNETYGQWKKEHPADLAALLAPPDTGFEVRGNGAATGKNGGNGGNNGNGWSHSSQHANA